MRKKDGRKQNEGIDFWQSSADMFSALLLVLMLVILALGLYLVHIPEYDQRDPWAGNTYAEGSKNQNENTDTPQPTVFFWFPGGGSGGGGENGGGETPHPTFVDMGGTFSPSPSPTVSPTPDLPGGGAGGGGGGEGGGEGAGEGPGDEPELGLKSAVYVMLADAETERTVKEANVEFELYGDNNSLQILNAYYPERIAFRSYATTEEGYFYLPEKIPVGTYMLHEITEPEGYDAAPNLEFTMAEAYDWPDPYVVRVQVYPSRNTIRVRMTDEDTGRGIGGGSFEILAAENIITADGTLRCRRGQLAGEIVCDETGVGESEELYLGRYILRQVNIPEYYVSLTEDIEAEAEKKSSRSAAAYITASARTRIHLSLADELYPSRGIGGASFRVTAEQGLGDPVEISTNSAGECTLDSLEKGVTYRIQQLTTQDLYRPDPAVYSVKVGWDGRIDGESEATLSLFNHMIRVSIGLTDEFSAVQVPNVRLTLYDAGGNLLRSWFSTGAEQVFTDLAPGNYYIIQRDDPSTRYDFAVLDQAEVQNIRLLTSYLLHYLILGGIALFLLLSAVILIVFIARRRRKKRGR